MKARAVISARRGMRWSAGRSVEAIPTGSPKGLHDVVVLTQRSKLASLPVTRLAKDEANEVPAGIHDRT
ncbi:MAG: hypothetical protein JWM91_4807 [Rhodospirillales bacterium]|nr:hypothetical protein [Rhodospirillales bacterium]